MTPTVKSVLAELIRDDALAAAFILHALRLQASDVATAPLPEGVAAVSIIPPRAWQATARRVLAATEPLVAGVA